jgi:hypothetical protein
MTIAENVETLPRPGGGNYEIARFNALRHGVLSQYTVLPWEDGDEYRELIEALAAEYSPQGPTEEHLVEELAGIIWRKRRLRLAESALHHRALKRATEPHQGTAKAALIHVVHDETEQVADVIRASGEQTASDLADVESDEAMTEKALGLLTTSSSTAYARAVAALRDDTREWWEDLLSWEPDDYDEGEEPFQADAKSLRRFLEDKVMPWYAEQRRRLGYRPLVRAQAFGEAVDPHRLERFGRYETHLDRKLERTLAMLLRLQDLRRAAAPS